MCLGPTSCPYSLECVEKQSEMPHMRDDLLAIDGSTRHPIVLFSPDRLAARE